MNQLPLLPTEATLYFVGGVDKHGKFTRPLTDRHELDDLKTLVAEWRAVDLTAQDTQSTNLCFVVTQDLIQSFAESLRSDIRKDLTALYEKFKTDDLNAIMRTFNMRCQNIIKWQYKQDAERFQDRISEQINYQKDKFFQVKASYRVDGTRTPNWFSNAHSLYENFAVLRNLLGISMLVDANTDYFLEHQVFEEDFNVIEERIESFLKSEKSRLYQALGWSMFYDPELVMLYESVNQEKITHEFRMEILKSMMVNTYPGEEYPTSDSLYRHKDIRFTDSWVKHYIIILTMLKEIRHLKKFYQLLLNDYAARTDFDVEQDPELKGMLSSVHTMYVNYQP